MPALIELHDEASGAKARIQVDVGFNCFSFSIPSEGGRWDCLWAEPGFERAAGRPSGSGNPLLFPFPGRIGGAEYQWDGRRYSLDPADGMGNAIHGFVYNRPWRVTEQSSQRAVAEFQLSLDAPDACKQWPADFQVSAAYTLHGATLRCDLTTVNTDEAASLPFGWGVHPYFRIPPGPARVTLPANSQWELQEMLPTGGSHALPHAAAWRQSGLKFEEMQFDDVFTDLHYEADVCASRLIGEPFSTELRFGKPFREIVVYTPGHRQAVCVEPYTCLPGAIQFPDLDAGLLTLQPGQEQRLWFEVEIVAS